VSRRQGLDNPLIAGRGAALISTNCLGNIRTLCCADRQGLGGGEYSGGCQRRHGGRRLLSFSLRLDMRQQTPELTKAHPRSYAIHTCAHQGWLTLARVGHPTKLLLGPVADSALAFTAIHRKHHPGHPVDFVIHIRGLGDDDDLSISIAFSKEKPRRSRASQLKDACMGSRKTQPSAVSAHRRGDGARR
jgi:hypothetical protein